MRVGVLKGYPTPTPLKPPLALSPVARTCGSACLALLARGCTTSLRGCARGRRQSPSLLLRLYPSGPRIPPALGSHLGARPGGCLRSDPAARSRAPSGMSRSSRSRSSSRLRGSLALATAPAPPPTALLPPSAPAPFAALRLLLLLLLLLLPATPPMGTLTSGGGANRASSLSSMSVTVTSARRVALLSPVPCGSSVTASRLLPLALASAPALENNVMAVIAPNAEQAVSSFAA